MVNFECVIILLRCKIPHVLKKMYKVFVNKISKKSEMSKLSQEEIENIVRWAYDFKPVLENSSQRLFLPKSLGKIL